MEEVGLLQRQQLLGVKGLQSLRHRLVHLSFLVAATLLLFHPAEHDDNRFTSPPTTRTRSSPTSLFRYYQMSQLPFFRLLRLCGADRSCECVFVLYTLAPLCGAVCSDVTAAAGAYLGAPPFLQTVTLCVHARPYSFVYY